MYAANCKILEILIIVQGSIGEPPPVDFGGSDFFLKVIWAFSANRVDKMLYRLIS